MGTNPSKFKDDFFDGLNPVESVTWDDCQDFLREINLVAPLIPETKGKWRLPTEIEWEYVAKAGTSSRWSFGNSDKDLDEHGWHAGNSGGRPKYVGQKSLIYGEYMTCTATLQNGVNQTGPRTIIQTPHR